MHTSLGERSKVAWTKGSCLKRTSPRGAPVIDRVEDTDSPPFNGGGRERWGRL